MALTDDFNRASLGSNWTNQALSGSTVGIVSNVAVCTSVSFAGMYWSANTWNADHHSKIKITGTLTYAAAGVRHSGSGATTNFYAYFSHGSLQKFVGAAQSILGSGGTVAPAGAVNGTIELDVVGNSTIGNTLRTTKDGVLGTTLSPADFALNGGAAGIAWYSTGAGADDWVGTGEVAAVSSTYTLTALSGSYSETGTAATLRATRRLVASAGTYALTGTVATLRRGRTLTASAGAYTYTGTAATLTFGAGPIHPTLSAESGAYTLTGTVASLRVAYRLIAGPGAFTYTGTAAALYRDTDVLPGELVTADLWIQTTQTMTAAVRTTVTMTAER